MPEFNTLTVIWWDQGKHLWFQRRHLSTPPECVEFKTNTMFSVSVCISQSSSVDSLICKYTMGCMKISLFHVNWFASAEQFCSVLRQLLPQYSVWALLLQNAYISNRLVAQGRISVIYVLFYHTCSCIRGQVQVRAALLMTTEIRYTVLCIYYECAATKLDQQHVESWLSEIEWIVETAS